MDRSNRRNRRAYTLLEISQNYLKVTSSSLGHISLYDIAIAVLENHPFPYSSGAESRLPVSESAKNPLFTFIVPTFPTLRLVKERKKKNEEKENAKIQDASDISFASRSNRFDWKKKEREKKIKRLLPISGSPGKRKKKFSLENSDRPF